MGWETFYIIIVTILFYLILIVGYSAAGYYYKAYQCNIDPNIWCWSDFTCKTECEVPGDTNGCYENLDNSLPECLYGINNNTVNLSNVCVPDEDGNAPNCQCPVELDDTDVKNCFQLCPLSRTQAKDLSTTTNCQITL